MVNPSPQVVRYTTVHLVAVKIMYISPYSIKDLQPTNKQLLYCCTASIYKLKPFVVNNCLVLVHLVAVKIMATFGHVRAYNSVLKTSTLLGSLESG
jgi:hypothetical protein